MSSLEDFPDLASGPEVFETSDVESEEPLSTENIQDSLDVQFDRLDPAAARHAFDKHSIVDTLDIPDFSGSLRSSLGRSGYTVSPWTETNGQRLARIAQELAEIKAEDSRQESEIDQLSQQINAHVEARGAKGQYHQELNEILNQIDDLVEIAEKKKTDKTKADKNKTENLTKLGSEGSKPAEVLALEKRLKRVEEAIGVEELKHGQNLQNHVSELSRKVSVLSNPELEISAITTEVAKLSKELEQLTASRRMAQLAVGKEAAKPKTPFETKVDSLYLKLEDMERARAVLPATIERLRGLHQIHSDLAHSVSTVGDLDATIDGLRRDMTQWHHGLNLVGAAVDEQAKKFEENKKTLEKSVADLEARLAEVHEL